jgi:acylphosphatase
MICLRLRIRGRVQGVAYRYWMVEAARAAGVAGWVRNCGDGSVEALVSGPRNVVDGLIARCREGPPAARVDDIECSDEPVPGLSGFIMRPTE